MSDLPKVFFSVWEVAFSVWEVAPPEVYERNQALGRLAAAEATE